MSQWCPVVVTTFAHLHSTNPELRFFTGSNPAAGVSEVCDDENIRQWSLLEIMPNILSANPTKWSVTLKQFVGNSRRIVLVCLAILWGWSLKC